MNKTRRLRQSSQYFRRYGRGLLSVLLLVGCTPEQLLDVSFLPLPSSTPSSTATPSPSTSKPESSPTPSPNVPESPTFKFPHTDTLSFHDDIRHPTPRRSESPLPEPSVEPTSPVGEPSSPPATPIPTFIPVVGDGNVPPSPTATIIPSPSVSSLVTNPPSQPMNLQASEVTATGVRLTWDIVTPLTYWYKVYINGKATEISPNIFPPPAWVGGLESSKAYKLEVAAYNEVGESPKSAPIEIFTLPESPKNVKITNTTQNSIILSWSPVHGATSYKIYLGDMLLFSDVTTFSKTIIIPNLVQGLEYKLDVVAVNKSGESQRSGAVTVFYNFLNVNDSASSNTFRLVKNEAKYYHFNVKKGLNYTVQANLTLGHGNLYVRDSPANILDKIDVSMVDTYCQFCKESFRAENDGIMYAAIEDYGNTSGSDGSIRIISYDDSLDTVNPDGGTLSLQVPVGFSLTKNQLKRYSFPLEFSRDYSISVNTSSGGVNLYASQISSVDYYVYELREFNINACCPLTFRADSGGMMYLAVEDRGNTTGSNGTITLNVQ